jgi:hypothetical protein
LEFFVSGAPGVAEKVDVESLTEAKTMLLAGVNQPVSAGSKDFESDSFWHEQSLASGDDSIKRNY